MSTELRLDCLLGREVHTPTNGRLGRLEEFRAERRGDEWVITTFVVGAAGLLERLGLGVRAVLGAARSNGYLVHWDQMDLTNPDQPRICCPVEDLERE
jgi:hypothetical protein